MAEMKRRSFLVALAGLALPALDTGSGSREQQIQYCRSRMFEQVDVPEDEVVLSRWVHHTFSYSPRWVVMK